MVKSKKLIIYGIHAVRHCLQESADRVIEVWVNQEKKNSSELNQILELAKLSSLPIHTVAAKTLDEKTHSTQHQGVALTRLGYSVQDESDLQMWLTNNESQKKLFLILDNVQDPHNLGACFRSADAIGVDGIIVSKDRSVGITSAVCKVASGAVETISFYSVTNLARTIRSLKESGVWVYGLDGDAKQTIYQTDFATSSALVMGAEGEGLRENTRKQCDQLVSIPMQGSIESLNVSAATAVCLFEVVRQRNL